MNTRLLALVAIFALFFANCSMAAEELQYFGAGKGTSQSPYWIENVEQLQNVRLFPNAYFVQTKDIYADDIDFLPIGDFKTPFQGHYDGEGHRIVIENLGATQGSIRLAGIWGFTSEAKIKNLNVEVRTSLKLDSRVCAGSIVACANRTDISNCTVSSDSKLDIVSEKCLYAGGIVGYAAFNSSVKNCSFAGRLTGRSNGEIDVVCTLGGIVGENRTGSVVNKSTFAESANLVGYSAAAPAWVGGIVGFNEGSTYVCDCHAVIPQYLKPDYKNKNKVPTEINKCNSAGVIGGYSSERIAVGGIVGFNAANVSNCLSQASTKIRGSITKCYNVPSALVGGVVGDNSGEVYNSSSLSSIQLFSNGFLAAGGIAGRNSRILKHCNYFSVPVKGSISFTAMGSFHPITVLNSASARGGITGVNDASQGGCLILDCKVLGAGKEKEVISSFGYSYESYGTLAGLELGTSSQSFVTLSLFP